MRAVPVVVAVALACSAAVGGAQVWPTLGEERDRWEELSPTGVTRAPARNAGHPPEVFEFFAARLRPGDRYYVHTPRGLVLSLTDERGIVRMLAGYVLLPAVQVVEVDAATVVLAYRADARELGVEYESVDRFRGTTQAAVARIAR